LPARNHPETASMPIDDLDYPAAIAYLYSLINYERTGDSTPFRFRLQRMRRLIDRLDLAGVAGDAIPVVHIAGTKGKGSTATMVAAMLTSAGIRTGLYTSPHLVDLEERFVVDSEMPTRSEMVGLVRAVREVATNLANQGAGLPTFFELTTAIALLHFKNRACQAVVLEVGLGGLLDSTNVCVPTVTAITSIGLDHQQILGNTLAEIAAQKAGIIKSGVPVVSGVRAGDAAAVIAKTAEQVGAPLFQIGRDFDFRLEPDSAGWRADLTLIPNREPIRRRDGWDLALPGLHQGQNASLACVILDLLGQAGTLTRLEDQAVGLARVRCAGRIERFDLRDGTEVILDTSHNVESISALCEFLESQPGERRITVIFGTSRDKPYRGMLERLAALADRIILTRYHANPRYRDPVDLLAAVPNADVAVIEEYPEAAFSRARAETVSPHHQIVICGSFFLAAEILPLLKPVTKRQDA